MSDSQQPPSVSEVLRASQLKDTLHHYGEALRTRRKGLDKLNVYPVPDGDTGTNMSLTVQSVVAELKSAVADDMHSIASAISKGAIMGARGNSGAILAQALRGIAESVKEKKTLDPQDVAEALERARKGAYESVLKPVEGTILTVLTAAAVAARKSSDEGHKLKEQLEAVRQASAEALARTPELLPQLKQAGVVDAGGSGFLLFVDALRFVATGEPIPGAVDTDDDSDDVGTSNLSEHSELSDLRYEIMFLLETKDDGRIAAFKKAWGEVGDSIVVVGGEGLFNCHIHSDEIGPAIEVALEFGRPSQIRITDLMEQVSERHGADWVADSAPSRESVATAVVAVLNGDGLVRLYNSLGVADIVTGGQSMNPSVADLLKAVEAAPSQSVILLPNNKNIIPTAEQVDSLTSKTVKVLRTISVAQPLGALLAFDPQADVDSNFDALGEALNSVAVGEITRAVRNSVCDAGEITEGDWLGLEAQGIKVIRQDLLAALIALVESLTNEDHEILTVVTGSEANEEVTARLQQWAAEARPNLEVQVHFGGQPLYPYVLGAE